MLEFPQKFKGISTVIAALLTHIVSTKKNQKILYKCLIQILGNVYTWSNINSYLASYIHLQYKNIKQTDCFFIVPTTILFDTYVIFFSGYFESKIGTRM